VHRHYQREARFLSYSPSKTIHIVLVTVRVPRKMPATTDTLCTIRHASTLMHRDKDQTKGHIGT